jgi:hypothetical protein
MKRNLTVKNLNKELSKSKDPEALLSKVVNHPDVLKMISAQKKDVDIFSRPNISKKFYTVVNHPRRITRTITITETTEVAYENYGD